MAIPKIIHQLWIGNKPVPNEWINTWKKAHPKWKHILWRETDIDALKLINRKQYDLMTELCGKKDIVQWQVLQQYGGFFIDADSECLNSLDDLLDADFICAYENKYHAPGLIANGIVACKPNHIVPIKCSEIISTYESINDKAWKLTGPTLLTKVINEYDNTINPMHQNAFYPFHYSGKNVQSFDQKIYANNFWMSTFKNKSKIKQINMGVIDCKYRFKNEYADQQITYRTAEGDKVHITAFNMTDALAEMILNDPHRYHILELKSDAKPAKKKSVTIESSVISSSALTYQNQQTDGEILIEAQQEPELESLELKRKVGRPKRSESK